MCGEWRTWTREGCMLGAMMLGSAVAEAQPAPSRVEFGGHLQVLRLEESGDANIGVGARVTVDVARWWSLEGEYQFLPGDTLSTGAVVDGRRLGIDYRRRRSTVLAGVKAGYRGERIGVFGKARPGVTVLSDRGADCRGDVCALVLLAVPEYRPEIALDLGAVVEIYASPRWGARIDVGTLVIRHRSTAPPCPASSCTTSNLAASAGFGVRF